MLRVIESAISQWIDEKQAVSNFRDNSDHYKKLLAIKAASDASKSSPLAAYSLYPGWSQLGELHISRLEKMQTASTFAELAEAIDPHFQLKNDEVNNKAALKRLVGAASNVNQDANFSYYLIKFLEEVKIHAVQNDYSLVTRKDNSFSRQ